MNINALLVLTDKMGNMLLAEGGLFVNELLRSSFNYRMFAN